MEIAYAYKVMYYMYDLQLIKFFLLFVIIYQTERIITILHLALHCSWGIVLYSAQQNCKNEEQNQNISKYTQLHLLLKLWLCYD